MGPFEVLVESLSDGGAVTSDAMKELASRKSALRSRAEKLFGKGGTFDFEEFFTLLGTTFEDILRSLEP